MFVIYNDKSHYIYIYNVLRKNSLCKENIYQLNLVRRSKKRFDLSLYDHKFDLIYSHWNTRETGPGHNVGFLMLSL